MAKKPTFLTVADDLVPCAYAAHDYLVGLGYRVKVEKADASAPFTTTMTATRMSTTMHVDVCGTIDLDRIKDWVAYGKSTGRDTRLVLCMPVEAVTSTAQEDALRKLGVGMFRCGADVTETISPNDLAFNVELPALPPNLREALGLAYEKKQRGEWRECFEEACNALEEEARRYLKHWSKSGRIKVMRKGKPVQLTASEINGLSIGGLANWFAVIVSPTSLDTAIQQVLSAVNDDRVERTHRRRAKRTETRLRQNVGRHMWHIFNVMKQMKE